MPGAEGFLEGITGDIKIVIHAKDYLFFGPVGYDVLKVETVFYGLHEVDIFLPIFGIFEHAHFLWGLFVIPHNVDVIIDIALGFCIASQVVVDHLGAV